MKKHFIIPTNFMETGYVPRTNGAIAIRNAVEAVILGLVGYMICKMLPLPTGTDGITYYILIIAPFALAGLYGVQGDPLSVFIVDFFKWRKRRKPCFYNSRSEAYTQEAADLLMNAPQMRDMLADALDKVRSSMASEDVVYVEGKTFVFASDPEQEALKMAQEEIAAKQQSELEKIADDLQQRKEEPAEKPPAFVKPDEAQAVSAEEIAKMLVLKKLDGEGEE